MVWGVWPVRPERPPVDVGADDRHDEPGDPTADFAQSRSLAATARVCVDNDLDDVRHPLGVGISRIRDLHSRDIRRAQAMDVDVLYSSVTSWTSRPWTTYLHHH